MSSLSIYDGFVAPATSNQPPIEIGFSKLDNIGTFILLEVNEKLLGEYAPAGDDLR